MKKLLSILALCFISTLIFSQGYQPIKHIIASDAIFPTLKTPLNGRTMYYDTSLFIYRDFQNTSEVLANFTSQASRFGAALICVHQGGTLNGSGVFIGGIRNLYWFRNGLADSNLVKFPTDTVVASGFLLAANNLSDLLSISTAKANLLINNVDNTSDATKNSAAVTLTNKTISGSNNTLINIPNSALNNSSIGITLGVSGTDVNVSGTPAALGSNFTFNIPVGGPGTTGKISSIDWNTFNNKQGAITLTTAGTSGPATFIGNVLNIPQYPAGVGGNGSADSIKHLFVDTSSNRNGYVLAFDSTNHKWYLSPNGTGTGITGLTGDGTASGSGIVPFTLATVNSNVGTFGSASSVAQFTTNAKGLTTAASSVAIQIGESQVTNLVSDLAGKQASLSGTGYLKLSGTTPSYLTPTQVTADLNVFTTSLQGLAPASGGGTTNFLRADGTWAAPPGGGGSGTVTNVAIGNLSPLFTTVVTNPTTSASAVFTLSNAAANTVFGNFTGSSAAPAFGKVTLATQATNTANYIQGWDGSGNPAALAPDTLFVKNRVSGTGVQLGNISNDTFYLNNLVAGTNITLTKNSDSSITVNASGGTFTNPMTTNGDMIYQVGGTYGRLAVAAHAGMKLTSGASGAIIWVDSTSGGGGSQTFQQTLTTGRTLANSDSILHAGFSLYHKGGLLKADSLHIGMSNGPPGIDTIVFFGPSTVVGVGASSANMRWSTKVSQRLGAIEKNLGVNSQMIINQSPFNPFGAVTTGLGDTTKIPTYVAGKHRYLIESWFKNDIAYSATNYDTVAYKSALRLWLNAAIRKGWPLSLIYLSSDGPEGQSAWNTDSVVYSLPAAANAARCVLFDDALKKLSIEYSIGFIDQYANFVAYSNPALHLSADSIHENDPAYGYEANYAIAQLGYDIKNIGQQLAVNGITDLDSARLHLTIPSNTSNYTSVVIDSISRLKGCTNCFLMNSPLQAQPFIGNTSQGITAGWLAPGFLRVTNTIPAAGIAGMPLSGEATEMQFNPTSHQGYLAAYNRTTGTPLPLNLQFQGSYLVVGSGVQTNSAQFNVAGIASVTGALWAGSTRLLSGFIDQTTASTGLTFRVNASTNTALTLNSNGSSTFFTPTSATPSIVLPAGTKPTSMGQGALAAETGHLWYHDGSTDYDLLSSSGGFANPMSAAGQMIYGGVAGVATATATPAHANMRPIWNGTAVVWTDTTAVVPPGAGSPGGSNQNIQVKSGSGFYGAANINYDTTNLWTLLGSSPLVATGTGAAAAGDLIVKAGNRWVSSAAGTTNTASFGITTGLIGEFRNYFSNGGSTNAWAFYTPAGGSTGTQVQSFSITSGGWISTDNGNPTYGTPIVGDIELKYGARVLAGSASNQFGSIAPNVSGMTELKNAYSLGAIDFQTSHGSAGSSSQAMSISTAGNLIVAASKTDNSNGLIQALSTTQAQLTLENTSTLYGSVQVNSAGSWGWRHMTGFTLPSAALAQGTASDSVLAIRTSASGIDTLVKILQPSGGGSGVTTVGAFSGSSIANGASISSNTITFGPADPTNPGMIKASGSQTLGPALTLNGQLNITGGQTFTIGTATDANYTVGTESLVKLVTITADRVATLPTASSFTGRVLTLTSYNTATFKWTTSPSIQDGNGTGLAIGYLVNGATYDIYSDGTNWIFKGIQYPVSQQIIQGAVNISTGSSTTMSNGLTNVIFDPPSAIATYTLTLPSNPPDGAVVKIHFGGTVTTGTVVTLLTISPNSGQTIVQNPAVTTGVVGPAVIYQFYKATNSWYREQ